MIRRIILICYPMALMLSCDRIMPGGLWDNFERDLRVEKISDQGPWGGTRTYYWKSETKGHFSKIKVIDFASSNGWSLVDSTRYRKDELSNMKHNGQANFTVQVGPFEPSSDDNFLNQDFPRWTRTDLTLFRFKTGWIIIYPGTDNSTEINGFITLSNDGTEMTLYHVWGE